MLHDDFIYSALQLWTFIVHKVQDKIAIAKENYNPIMDYSLNWRATQTWNSESIRCIINDDDFTSAYLPSLRESPLSARKRAEGDGTTTCCRSETAAGGEVNRSTEQAAGGGQDGMVVLVGSENWARPLAGKSTPKTNDPDERIPPITLLLHLGHDENIWFFKRHFSQTANNRISIKTELDYNKMHPMPYRWLKLTIGSKS